MNNNCNDYLHTYLWMTLALTIWHIYSIDQHEFEVHHSKEQYAVNILVRTCSCRQWDLDLISSSHACIAFSTRNLNLYTYTNKFYYVSNLINLYKNATCPIGSVDQIRKTYQGGNDRLLPCKSDAKLEGLKKEIFVIFGEKGDCSLQHVLSKRSQL